MISKIETFDPFMVVSTPSQPYINSYAGNLSVGNVRFNTSTQCLETYDGNNWVAIHGPHMGASVGLTARAQAILVHAEKQMMQDEKFNRLAKDNVTIADALAAYREAAEKLQVVISLCEE